MRFTYTLAHFAIKGWGNDAPAPTIVIGEPLNQPIRAPAPMTTTAITTAATAIHTTDRPRRGRNIAICSASVLMSFSSGASNL